jgi:hypothetical protein
LHIAFAAFTAIGGGWIAVLTWILTRRSCPTALDRIATSWMATIASGLFLAVGVPIAVMREGIPAALSLTFVGAGFLCGSLLLLRRAYFICRKLRAKLAELEV